MTKQATHVQPDKACRLEIMVCNWGGFLVRSLNEERFSTGEQAAFSRPDECADWVRDFLRKRRKNND